MDILETLTPEQCDSLNVVLKEEPYKVKNAFEQFQKLIRKSKDQTTKIPYECTNVSDTLHHQIPPHE